MIQFWLANILFLAAIFGCFAFSGVTVVGNRPNRHPGAYIAITCVLYFFGFATGFIKY